MKSDCGPRGPNIDRPSGAGRIVFPLDVSEAAEAVRLAGLLRRRVGLFKIGLELFVRSGPAVVEEVRGEGGTGIFLDLKFHDIPETVRRAAAAAAALGVEFLTVHAGGGSPMLRAAVEGAGGRTAILAVTVLTSLAREELRELGLREELTDPKRLVLRLARLARDCGCAGVVCSGKEVRAVKEVLGRDFTALVPGIRPSWSVVGGDDQARVATPAAAIAAGADYLVVGRPLRDAADPASAAGRLAAEISAAEEGGLS